MTQNTVTFANYAKKLKIRKSPILTAYTIAENCTDATDCLVGIDELQTIIRRKQQAAVPVSKVLISRLNALCFDLYIKYNKTAV